MSLGVLNNLSAMYAAHNLNNTNESLSKTLQQLSSGSKINSGADDAAGLSLVNGLQANSQALAQSQTNAQEGVGLLQVADGALSQVTNLLNRAVTLATEVSNGTLNGSQQSAANQEYQSILSEISNIGSTTTYNQKQVFGASTDIYTGDSSTSGASVNSLNIRSLSSSNIGDTGGVMSYGSGSSNSTAFIDLGANATAGDAITAGTATINVTYLSGNTTATKAISVGSGTGYANTAQGMINAINNSGLGLSASFSTDKVAGVAGASGDKGIMITGSVGASGNASRDSFSGVVKSSAGNIAATDKFTGSLTLQDGTNAATTITAAQVAASAGVSTGAVAVSDLITYINNNTGLGVTAAIGTGSQAGQLTLTSTGNTNALKVSSNLTDTTLTVGSNVGTTSYAATAAFSVGLVADGTNVIEDSSAAGGHTAQVTADAVVLGTSTGGGVATISYSDQAGTSLAGTDLSSQADAQAVLTALNSAISSVSAQDGYIGAQINTLNAVGQVLSTQQQNVVAAQNAVQATDYAQAASNMSKYQILSQTGISALAQANSMQQEVTKLLQ